MTTPLLDGYGCALGLMAITRPSKPSPLGMQPADTAGRCFSGTAPIYLGAALKPAGLRHTCGEVQLNLFTVTAARLTAHNPATHLQPRALLTSFSSERAP